MKCRSLRKNEMEQVYYIKTNKIIDFRYWLLREMTGISDNIRNSIKVMPKLC